MKRNHLDVQKAPKPMPLDLFCEAFLLDGQESQERVNYLNDLCQTGKLQIVSVVIADLLGFLGQSLPFEEWEAFWEELGNPLSVEEAIFNYRGNFYHEGRLR